MSKTKPMLVKFESKSNRVKGIAFHPKRPWILASLHNGVIQLWDYRMEVLIDRFEEHDGPVRGVHFHHTQPLFVSGGDDYKIKVWNYTQRRCLFNLLGHLDYIRTVQFHREYPWILSASDDQTIRIWNWQSRSCLSVLTGHNHYVMCAQFHPKEDLVISASLDQTVRVWDVAGLKKKTVSIAGSYPQQQNDADIFGASDVIVKHVLEGHSRGVNWAAFHKSLALIVSGADDREVKLWRMNDSKAWEVDTMRGHLNNVSCVMFHPKKELIISNSEDKTIRVWDIAKQQNPLVLRREHDRYWILDAHPTLNLMAAGHDNGLIVFKLNRERPPCDSADPAERSFYYFKDLYIYEYSYKTGKERPLLATRKRGTNMTNNVTYRHLHYNWANQAQSCFLVTSDADGSYELYIIPKDNKNGGSVANVQDDGSSTLKGYARCVVFVSRNRFALLDKTRTLYLKTLKNEVKRKITIPNVTISYIFPGGLGRLLIRTSEGMLLYDIQSLKVLAEMPTQSRHPIKYVCWSPNHQFLAMYSKATIYVTNSKLEDVVTVNENSRIKSGAWDPIGVFVYTTATHIKYLLPNGENGILRTLDFPIYITAASSNSVTYLDREGVCGKLTIDATEYLFKLALWKHKNREVLRIMQTKKLVGESIIAYLHKKGYPEVALHFVEDPQIKFSLALECGNIGVALECATKLDNDESWHKLGVEALRQGNHQVVEAAYQKTKNFERLSFLYLITGNMDKLAKMLHIATLRNDMMGRFHNSLYLGNVSERVKVLQGAGQLQLAYITAKTHGLEEEAAALAAELGEKLPQLPADLESKAQLLFPPTPILRDNNWPLLEVRKGFFDQAELPDEEAANKVEEEARYEGSDDEEGDDEMSLGWGDSGDKKKKKGQEAKAAVEDAAEATAAGASWGDDLDIDLPAEAEAEAAAADDNSSSSDDFFVMPSSGKTALDKWSSNSSLAADLVAAGSFDLAMHMLHRQIGLVNFAPLKEAFLAIHNAAQAQLPMLPFVPALPSPLYRNPSQSPNLAYKLSQVVEPLKSAYKNVTEGKFAPALQEFLSVLHTLPLVVVEKKAEVQEVGELLGICREYVTAIRLELTRRDTADPVKQAALRAYFTQCKLQTTHLILGLQAAVKYAYTIKNFAMTAGFCRRILELAVSNGAGNSSVAAMVDVKKIRAVLQVCEKTNTDEHQIDYPENHFVLCSSTLTPIPKNVQPLRCPYCASTFHPSCDEQLCPNCQLAQIGAQATGLRVFAE